MTQKCYVCTQNNWLSPVSSVSCFSDVCLVTRVTRFDLVPEIGVWMIPGWGSQHVAQSAIQVQMCICVVHHQHTEDMHGKQALLKGTKASPN